MAALEKQTNEIIGAGIHVSSIVLGIFIKLLNITAKSVVAATETYEQELQKAMKGQAGA